MKRGRKMKKFKARVVFEVDFYAPDRETFLEKMDSMSLPKKALNASSGSEDILDITEEELDDTDHLYHHLVAGDSMGG